MREESEAGAVAANSDTGDFIYLILVSLRGAKGVKAPNKRRTKVSVSFS